MRLGLIARADDSGLGVQSLEFFRHMHPDKVLVIDVGHLHNDTTHTNKRTDLSRYPGAVRCEGWLPSPQMMLEFMLGLDVVFSCETFYRPDVPDMARGMGIRTVLQPNHEFLDLQVRPDLWAAPTLWNYDLLPDPKTHLPVPIATDRFTPTNSATAARFLHIVGRPAVHDRNGTQALLEALQFVKSPVTVTIKCQTPGFVEGLLTQHRIPGHVTVWVDSAAVNDYWDNYTDQDVLVMPRRFGGLCLPVNEALGAGLPVIMPNISPNDWLPTDWLIPATFGGSFRAKQHVDLYDVDVHALAALMDRFATDRDFYTQALREVSRLRDEYSWATLEPLYRRVLGEVN